MSLIHSFTKLADDNARKIALITAKSQMTYDDLLQLTYLFDFELKTRGVRPGQTIVMDSTRPEFCIVMGLLLSLRSLTVVFAPLESVIAAGVTFDRVITETPSSVAPAEKQIVVEANWFQLLGTLPTPALPTEGSGTGAFVFRTSGSTGMSKFVHSLEDVRQRQAESGDFLGEVDLSGRRVLSTMTIRTGWAFTTILATLLAGGSVVALDDEIENMLPWTDLYHVDTMATTPAILQILLSVPKVDQYLASLRDIRLGGAFASPKLLETFSQRCPAKLHIGYGSAELGACFRAVFSTEHHKPQGYLGQFMRPDLEIGFFDAALQLLPGATEGIVGFRPRDGAFSRQYLSMPDDDKTGFIDGWFFPGDILRCDGEDYFLLGRTKDIVNFGGNKFALGLVREALGLAFPEAPMAPVVIFDADGLERLAVAYVASRQITEAEMNDILAPRFKGLRVLRAMMLKELPLTESGKIDMAKVKSLFEQD